MTLSVVDDAMPVRPFGRLPPSASLPPSSAAARQTKGRHLKGFLGLPLNDRTILSLVILFDKTVSVG